MKIAMIPARMGSQRLKQKNLKKIEGVEIIGHAIRKCFAADVFDEVWVNSEHPTFGEIAVREGAKFHRRPDELANNVATSEQFVYEFLKAHECDWLFQVHSIAPLMTTEQVKNFVQATEKDDCDALLSCTLEQIECAMDGKPVNFSLDEKTNSQELSPIQRVTWSITGWRAKTYLEAYEAGKTATYAGRVGFFPLDRLSGHIIKTQEDMDIAEALFSLVHSTK